MISIVLPVYNEGRQCPKTIKEIRQVMDKLREEYEIIVINDGSKEDTGEIIREIKDISMITNPYNLGYGASIKRGIERAKGEWILITDCDGTYPIKDIPRLLEHTNLYDMVVGARTGKNVRSPLVRKPAKLFLKIFANFLVKKNIPDLNSGFRVFKKSMALKFFNKLPSRFSLTTTLTLLALQNDHPVKYVSIDYYKRVGSSSVSPFDFFNFLGTIFRITSLTNPMRTFTLLSCIFFILGIIRAVRDIFVASYFGGLTILLFLLSFQIFFVGIILDILVKSK